MKDLYNVGSVNNTRGGPGDGMGRQREQGWRGNGKRKGKKR